MQPNNSRRNAEMLAWITLLISQLQRKRSEKYLDKRESPINNFDEKGNDLDKVGGKYD